eukprot:COSAG02_NODE_3505_length_6637_cov_2.581217_9_plen_200_part_00
MSNRSRCLQISRRCRALARRQPLHGGFSSTAQRCHSRPVPRRSYRWVSAAPGRSGWPKRPVRQHHHLRTRGQPRDAKACHMMASAAGRSASSSIRPPLRVHFRKRPTQHHSSSRSSHLHRTVIIMIVTTHNPHPWTLPFPAGDAASLGGNQEQHHQCQHRRRAGTRARMWRSEQMRRSYRHPTNATMLHLCTTRKATGT